MSAFQDCDIAVLGAGIAGLVAGEALQRGGRDVIVLDGDERAGGVIRSETIAGAVVEWGPQSFLGTPALASLVSELGLVIDTASVAAKRRYVVRDGRLSDVPMSPSGLLKTDLLSFRGKLRMLLEPLLHGRPGSDDESIADLATRHLGAEACRYLVAPFVSGVYAGDPHQLEAKAAFPILAELERIHPSLFIAMVRRMRAQRRGPRARSMGSFSVRGGNEGLPRALAARLGSRLRLGAAVERLRRDGDGGMVITTTQLELRARKVVLAMPAPAAARVVAGAAPDLAELLLTIAYAPVRLVHFRVGRDDVLRDLDGFGHLVPRSEGFRHLGCLWTSASYPSRAGEDEALFAVFLGGALDPAAASLDGGSASALAWEELCRLGVVRGAPRDAYVAPRPRAIAQYERGHRERVAAAEAMGARLGMTLIGSAFHGVAVGEVVRTGRERCEGLFPA